MYFLSLIAGFSFSLLAAQSEQLNVLLRNYAILGKTRAIQAALKQGANIDAPAEFGETALYHATLNRQTQTVLFLLQEGANPNLTNYQKKSPLYLASSRCDVPSVQALLKKGAKINTITDQGKTALITATEANCVPVVALLLKQPSIKVAVRDESFQSALDYARHPWIVDMLKLALEKQEREQHEKNPLK